MRPALEVEHLSHSFGDQAALADVSFAVTPGTFAVLLGLNGAGKTTLFSLATGLYHTRAGRIRIFGRDFRTDPGPALAALGVVFQQPTLDLDLTVRQNLRYHGALQGLSAREADARGAAELARIGAADLTGRRVRTLSGGQRRRIEIARALLHGPRLLLLDEPTVGLDMEVRQAILGHVRALVAERGLSVLWATHLMDEVAATDQVIVLHRGEVRHAGGAGDLLQTTGAETVAAAFAALTGAGKR